MELDKDHLASLKDQSRLMGANLNLTGANLELVGLTGANSGHHGPIKDLLGHNLGLL